MLYIINHHIKSIYHAMNFTNITFTGIPEQKINMDYTWDEIITYYYHLFLYVFGSSSYIYLLLWIQNKLIDRDLSFYDDYDTDSDTETEKENENEKDGIFTEIQNQNF